MSWTLKKGDRIRLKVRTAFGFKGYAVVLDDAPSSGPGAIVSFRPEGCDDPDYIGIACRHEVAKCRTGRVGGGVA